MPEWPRIVAGYEYQLRTGRIHTAMGAVARMRRHSVRTLETSFRPRSTLTSRPHPETRPELQLRRVAIGGQCAPGVYKLETGRQDVLADSLGSPPNVVATINETDRHTQAQTPSTSIDGWRIGCPFRAAITIPARRGRVRGSEHTGQHRFYYQNYQWSADDVVLRRQSQVPASRLSQAHGRG